MASPRLELRGGGRRFGDRWALRDVHLVIEPGETVALVGPSGGGKTTLLRVLGGSLCASTGSVLVDGEDLEAMRSKQLRAHRRHCGIVTQGAALVPQLTVHANVVAGLLGSWPWWKTLGSLAVPLEKA